MEPTAKSLPDYYGTALPPQAKKWSWGGFLLTWIWGLGNGVWIALLALVPFPFLGLGVSIYLGVKGRELAWRSRQWPSPESFAKTQRRWTFAALMVLLISFSLSVAAGVLIAMYISAHPDDLDHSVSTLSLNVSNQLAIEKTYGRDNSLSIILPEGWQSSPWGESGLIAGATSFGFSNLARQSIIIERGSSAIDSKVWRKELTENVTAGSRIGVLTTYKSVASPTLYRYVLQVSSSNGIEVTATAESEDAAWQKNQRVLRQSLLTIDY